MSLKNEISKKAGFTLVELIVTVAIFVFMTALVVAKYGSFNDGTLLTSMAYDIALTLRDAQSYGLNVQGYTPPTGSQSFSYPYGMHFQSASLYNNEMILFADSYPQNQTTGVYGDGICTDASGMTCQSGTTEGDTIVTTYTLARGGLIKCLYVSNTPPLASTDPCQTSDSGSNVVVVDITFKRPDPNAIIKAYVDGSIQKFAYAVIQVENASKNSTRSIVVNETGEIAVQNQ